MTNIVNELNVMFITLHEGCINLISYLSNYIYIPLSDAFSSPSSYLSRDDIESFFRDLSEL